TSLSTESIYPRALAYQSDGKLLVGGYSVDTTPYYNAVLARYTSTGTLDSTFSNTIGGSDGFIKFCWRSASSCATNSLYTGVLAIDVQSDGKIVVGGKGKVSDAGTGYTAALARFNANGSFDTSFGTEGRNLYSPGPINSDSEIQALRIQSTGSILASGSSTNGSAHKAFALRVLSTGSLDATGQSAFGDTAGNSGCATVGCIAFSYAGSTGLQGAIGLAEDSNGKIYLTGNSGANMGIARLTSVGALDSGFGSSGSVTLDAGTNYDYGNALVIDSANRLVIRTEVGQTGDAATCIFRIGETGVLDSTFAAETSTAGKICHSRSFGGGTPINNGLALDSDGNILYNIHISDTYATVGLRRRRP
ncbi:MAG: delta-60 repeat domain-containing protein, partial [Bdellovibrionota bacterium]